MCDRLVLMRRIESRRLIGFTYPSCQRLSSWIEVNRGARERLCGMRERRVWLNFAVCGRA